jgi:hypothetical protein
MTMAMPLASVQARLNSEDGRAVGLRLGPHVLTSDTPTPVPAAARRRWS